MLTPYKAFFNRGFDPVARMLARTGLSPLALTLTTPVLTALICWWFFRTRHVWLFGCAMGAVAALDGVDGALARATGQVSKLGGYLDALCDRYVDSLVILTVAAVTGHWALALVLLAGALLVSYAKARAAMEVPVGNAEWPDLMERTERLIFLLVGLAISEQTRWVLFGRDLAWWTLLVLAGLVHVTVVQRVLRAKRFIEARQAPKA